uniref:Peptidase S1 domain-containing protein n=1 Tax=Anopheles farauti TaxID=69004 RepID=A0A1Y9HAM3_9DIPT
MGERWPTVRKEAVVLTALLACVFLSGAVPTLTHGAHVPPTECDSQRGYCVSRERCSVRTFRLRSNRCPTYEEVCCPKKSFPPDELKAMGGYDSAAIESLPTHTTSTPRNVIVPQTVPNGSTNTTTLVFSPVPAVPAVQGTSSPSPITSVDRSEVGDASPVARAEEEQSETGEPEDDSTETSPTKSKSNDSNLEDTAVKTVSTSNAGPNQSEAEFRTEYGEFPWSVALFRKAENRTFCCNGALIGARAVLTTAHCVSLCGSLASNIVALVGEWNISTTLSTVAKGIGVKTIHSHVFYPTSPHSYNIALLKLKGQEKYAAIVQPVRLSHLTQSQFNRYTNLTAIDWSGPKEQHLATELVQKKISLQLLQLPTCTNKIKSTDKRNYSPKPVNVLCTNTSRSEINEGTPVVAKVNDQYYLRGLVSWDYEFEDDAIDYTLLVDVQNFIYWINTQLRYY